MLKQLLPRRFYSKIEEKDISQEVNELFAILWKEYNKHRVLERSLVTIFFSTDYFVDTTSQYDMRISDRHEQINDIQTIRQLQKIFATHHMRMYAAIAYDRYNNNIDKMHYVGIMIIIKPKKNTYTSL